MGTSPLQFARRDVLQQTAGSPPCIERAALVRVLQGRSSPVRSDGVLTVGGRSAMVHPGRALCGDIAASTRRSGLDFNVGEDQRGDEDVE
jgi:hypothetical protein